MINQLRFVKEKSSLCAYSLSLAVLGYLGCSVIRWIINNCQRTQTVQQVAQNTINNINTDILSPKAPVKLISNLEISEDKITVGQGEYIVFHQSPTGEKQPLSLEIFKQVYEVLLQHSPIALANNGSDRYELIKAKLKEIDPTLEAVFVPKTLYELIFIRQCINEDLTHKGICPEFMYSVDRERREKVKAKWDPVKHPKEYRKFVEKEEQAAAEIRQQRRCWHLCYFTDMGNSEDDGVKDVAYRLNNIMVEIFDPSSKGFTHQEISAFAEKEIEFLKAHYKKTVDEFQRRANGEKIDIIIDCNKGNLTTSFCFDRAYSVVIPMAVSQETYAQIIRNAIALECSKIAQHSLFLYRGADFQKDSVSCWDDKDKPFSLSYGTSLFAGCVYGRATAFHYMRRGQNAYAIPVDFNELNRSPFFVPTTHTVAQLFGSDEIFHGRTRVWKDFNLPEIKGINPIGRDIKKVDHLGSNLNKEELESEFKRYKNKAVQLK